MHNKTWHLEAVPADVIEKMKKLAGHEALNRFYLAGGTALALHMGHRISRDLDFFSESFDAERALAQLRSLGSLSVMSIAKETLHIHFEGIKVSLLGYPYPLLFATELFEDVRVADQRDIATMKLSAVAGRGSKRDFIDLYVISRDFGLLQLIALFKRRFSGIEYNVVHLLKSLTYFEDADKEPTPSMLLDIRWEEVKRFFVETAPALI